MKLLKGLILPEAVIGFEYWVTIAQKSRLSNFTLIGINILMEILYLILIYAFPTVLDAC